MDNLVRLQKYMAEAGVASRRKSEELIMNGKVKVNGHVAHVGDKINPNKDLVTVRGKRISIEEKKYYIALNKPRGYITTVSDDFDRKTVMDLVSTINARIYPVGRLDRNSEGLLFLTNDGEFANIVEHPGHNFSKVYHVTVKPNPTDEVLLKLQNGVEIDGKKTMPCKINTLKNIGEKTVLEFTLKEGRNRQIRKMCEAVDLQVVRLKRVSIGPINVDDIQLGKWRMLTEKEVDKILKSAK